jgi:hypothetical protein
MKDSDRNRAVLAEVVARSWRDPAFRTSLKANPKQAVTAADMARYQFRFDATVKRWFSMRMSSRFVSIATVPGASSS